MKQSIINTVACLVTLVAPVSTASGQQWVSLFNGKDLEGWTQINGFAKFEAKDGAIVGTSAADSPNSFLCTKKQYGDFELEFEVKVDKELNSGVQVRSESKADYQNGRVHGYQVEIAVGGFSGGIYDEARRNKFLNAYEPNAEIKGLLKANAWNRYKVICQGDRIRTWVNGKQVSNLKDNMTARGFIGLQVHAVGKKTEPLHVAWRNIRLKEIARQVIFSENFEGEFPGSWASQGNVPAALFSGTPKRGKQSLRLAGSPIKNDGIAVCWMDQIVSTVGYRNIQVSMYFAAKGLQYKEHADFLWNDIGPAGKGHWSNPLSIKAGDAENDGALRHYSLSLSDKADNNPNLTLAFYMWGLSAADHCAFVDDIVVTGEDAGGKRVTIFSDDFEKQFPGKWNRSGPASANIVWSTDDPKRGAHAVRFMGSSSPDEEDFDCYMQRGISTVGWRNIQVSFYAGASGLQEEAESIIVYWVGHLTSPVHAYFHKLAEINGGSPNNDGALHGYSSYLPEEADNNPHFMLHFILAGTSAANQCGYVDDLVVTGEKFTGPESSCVGVMDNAKKYSENYILNGGVAPSCGSSTSDFGDVNMGSTVARLYYLHNTGKVGATVGPVAADGDFTIIAQPASSIAAKSGYEVSFKVQFKPTAAGVRTGTVTFRTVDIGNENAGDTLHTFTVRGVGRGEPSPENRKDNVGSEAKALGNGTVRVAGIVLRWIYKDKEANFRRLAPMVREAAKGGARIIVTTECALDGYLMKDDSIPPAEYRALAEPIPDGKYFRRLAALAEELKVHLVAGMTEVDGELCYNTAALIGPNGKLIGRYRKHKLMHEVARNMPGTDTPAFDTDFGRLGMMICADRTDPELVGRIVADGAEFLLCLSGGMAGATKNDPILQARSKENGRYIVFVHPRQFLVTAPDGRVLTSALTGSDKEVADINAGLGSDKAIASSEAGSGKDAKGVFYFDLPLKPRPTRDTSLDLLLPAPQEIEAGTGRVPLGPSIRLYAPEEWSSAVGSHLWLLNEVLQARKAGPVVLTKDANTATIRIVRTADALPKNGYELKIAGGAIELAANDSGGMFNGLATLAQLIELSDSQTIDVPCCRIRDWPEVATRAVHIDMTCQQYNAAYIQRLMKTLARYKVNAILMEYSAMFPFREHKAICRPDAFTEKELQAILRTARECNQEIIPFLQCAGHLEYVLTRPEYAQLSQGHGGYGYCPTNDAVLPFAESLIDEILAQHPGVKRLHIGGDEVGPGRGWPGTCQRCAKISVAEFHERYLKHYKSIAEYCLKRDIAPMQWTDVIGPFRLQGDKAALAAKVREAAQVLPHEIIGVDWNYYGKNFPVVSALRDVGFQAITASAARCSGDCFALPTVLLHMENIQGGFLRAGESKLDGSIITSWSYRGSPHEVCLPEYAAAAYGWNTREADVPAFLARFFRQRYGLSGTDASALALAALAETKEVVPTTLARPKLDKDNWAWTIPATQQAEQLTSLIGKEDPKRLQASLEGQIRLFAGNDGLWRAALDSATRHQDELRSWDLSRRHLQHRLALSLALVQLKSGGKGEQHLRSLAEARSKLRDAWTGLYRNILTPRAMEVDLDMRFDVEPGIVEAVRGWQQKTTH